MAITLDSLQKSTARPSRDLIYGVQGIGKTTLATQMSKPVFLAAEEGLGGLLGVDNWRIESYQDALEAITALHGDHQFQTVVFDTVSAFEPMLLDRLVADWGVDSIEKVGVNGGGFFKWRVESLPLWEMVLRGLDSLRINKGMRIVLIGHSTSIEIKPPEADPYRKYTLDLLNPKASDLIYRWADVVAFCNYKVAVTGAVKKGDKITAGRAIGSGERVMYLSERPAFYAKNRFGLPDEIPLSCENYLAAFNPQAPPKNQEKK